MPDNENRGPHLRTKFVFIDTQAFRKARCDWNGRVFSKVVEFAKEDRLRLLVTDVTVEEVKSQLQEMISEASISLARYSGILEQLGASVAVDRVQDKAAALAKLQAGFENFLTLSRAQVVPLISDVKGLLDDYFARRPPFSDKKKHEFPDAISIASLRNWCKQNKSTVYIVSEDSDLKACCSETGPFFHVATTSEIISRATVSQALHDALEKALRASEYLSEYLADAIAALDIRINNSWSARRGIEEAKIVKVHSVYVNSVNVLEQQGQTYTCEPEISAEVEFEIVVGTIEENSLGPHRRLFSVDRFRQDYFYPEVIVRFNESNGELVFESISLADDTEIVSMEDVNR